MQWRFQAISAMRNHETVPDSSGLSCPVADFKVGFPWFDMFDLSVGQCVAYHYVHEIKSDYDELQVTNSRNVSVLNDQCDQY
jgi:hypothetical protein